MKVHVWRITHKHYVAEAFTGTGAWLEGARWNYKGVFMTYTSGTLSLAALEILVHLQKTRPFKGSYVHIPVEFDSSQMILLNPADLPEDWRNIPPSESTQKIGSDWAKSLKSLVLRVPSSVIPIEHNYLINPLHPEASTLKIGQTEPFDFDTRLVLP